MPFWTRKVIYDNVGDIEVIDDKNTLVLDCTNINLKAFYILLAITTKAGHNSVQYQYLKEISTDDLPLGTLRKEWLVMLMDLHDDCFMPDEEHILPMLYTKQIKDPEKRKLLHKSYEILSHAVCGRLFNNVTQLIYNNFVVNVPTEEGKMYFRTSSFIITIIFSMLQNLRRKLLR